MQIPAKIKEKMLKVNELQKELCEWCGSNLDEELKVLHHGKGYPHFVFVSEPLGEEQDNGEYADQHEEMGYYTGSYYYPCEDGSYLVCTIQSLI